MKKYYTKLLNALEDKNSLRVEYYRNKMIDMTNITMHQFINNKKLFFFHTDEFYNYL